MKTCEIDIRKPLHNNLKQKYIQENDNVIIIDEFVVGRGKARVDIAVIDGILIGYEIKSDSDNLKRLPNQINIYNKVFDEVSIVTGESHLSNVTSIVPGWWGIYVANSYGNDVKIELHRPPKRNNYVDAFEIVKFLQRDELLYLVDKYNLDKKFKRYPMFEIWPRVIKEIPLLSLKNYVRNCLKSRKG